MTRQAIDPSRRSAKRERARRRSGDLFLYRRAFTECADRLALIALPPERMLIVTCPGLEWTAVASEIGNARVVALDALEPHSADLIVAVGVLDQADDPTLAAFILNHALEPGGRLLGAALGGRSLERLRRALLDAERVAARAVQRFHPMLDGPALADLLNAAGLRDVVLDVDRVAVNYRGLAPLVADLRDMGCTASLAGKVQPLQRKIYEAAGEIFSGGLERVPETFEILHFSARSANAV